MQRRACVYCSGDVPESQMVSVWTPDTDSDAAPNGAWIAEFVGINLDLDVDLDLDPDADHHLRLKRTQI